MEYVAARHLAATQTSVRKMLDTQFSAIFMKKISSNFSSERCFSLFSASLDDSRVAKTILTHNKRLLILMIRPDNYFRSKNPTIRIYIFLADSNQKTFHSTPCKTQSPNARDFSHWMGEKKIFFALFQNPTRHGLACVCKERDSLYNRQVFVIKSRHTSIPWDLRVWFQNSSSWMKMCSALYRCVVTVVGSSLIPLIIF